MASTKQFILHDDLMGGVDASRPAHLLGKDQWTTQHNIRLTPGLQQIPNKYVSSINLGVTDDVRWVGIVPTPTPGYGKVVVLTPVGLYNTAGTRMSSALVDDSTVYRRWATALYNGSLFYTNELNALRINNGSTDLAITNAAAGRYLTFWYDHAVIAAPLGYTDRMMFSDLYDFSKWVPDATNEADYYDVVEWQQTDYPYTGITGIGKLHGTLWVYTPTAIIPFSYVGKPKIIRLNDEGVITRTGNTYPWTMVALDTVHFYYDAVEAMFFAFDGQQVIPIGEPVRQYMLWNLSTNLDYAAKMYGYIDANYREVWWPFVSKNSSTGAFDKAVVFNYRYKKWYTASVENVQCFCVGSRTITEIGSLTGTITALSGTISQLGTGATAIARVYGSDTGHLLLEETDATTPSSVIAMDDSVLESPDFHYGDVRMVKENDAMIINAALNTGASINIDIATRSLLSIPISYPATSAASWTAQTTDLVSTYSIVSGRILRYKFTFKNARLCSFDAFSDSIYAKAAEK